jgi:hypothetical protein
MNKPRSDAFSEKISPEQKLQVIEWLSDHSYTETAELVAAPPPDGFGIEVSRAALCRFYKTHFEQIETARREKFSVRAINLSEHHFRDPDYRAVLAESADLFLQDRYFEALTRPVESIDDLKKLVAIAQKIKDLKLELDPAAKAKKEAENDKTEQLVKALADAMCGGANLEQLPPHPKPCSGAS